VSDSFDLLFFFSFVDDPARLVVVISRLLCDSPGFVTDGNHSLLLFRHTEFFSPGTRNALPSGVEEFAAIFLPAFFSFSFRQAIRQWRALLTNMCAFSSALRRT